MGTPRSHGARRLGTVLLFVVALATSSAVDGKVPHYCSFDREQQLDHTPSSAAAWSFSTPTAAARSGPTTWWWTARTWRQVDGTHVLIETDGTWFRLVEVPIGSDLSNLPAPRDVHRGDGTRWIRARPTPGGTSCSRP